MPDLYHRAARLRGRPVHGRPRAAAVHDPHLGAPVEVPPFEGVVGEAGVVHGPVEDAAVAAGLVGAGGVEGGGGAAGVEVGGVADLGGVVEDAAHEQRLAGAAAAQGQV